MQNETNIKTNPALDQQSNEDTIAAISTPIGQAGIGIVRLSGALALPVSQKIFKSKQPVERFESHRLYLGLLMDPATGDIIDEVLFSYMKAPRSYTGEDVAEINSHSGYYLLSKILQIVLKEGARLAKPGEFTFRAFLHGRIDLTQAEAIIDLINSKSERGLVLASNQIRGQFRDEVEGMRQIVLDMLANTEVAIDFPDEGYGTVFNDETVNRIENELIDPMKRIIDGYEQRKLWFDGIRTVIAGRVNAGKSSLLNRLLNEERAIVTPVPGTTRDVIESTVHMEGLPIRLMDTAGFRKATGAVEKIGIRMTEEKLKQADLALVVLDRSRPLDREDRRILDQCRHHQSLIVLNKIDLPARISEITLNKAAKNIPVIPISALTGEGIQDLVKAIKERVMAGITDPALSQLVPNLRHKTALEQSLQHLENAASNIREKRPLDIIAMDFTEALEALGEIIGQTTNEEVLDRIFSDFCLGK